MKESRQSLLAVICTLAVSLVFCLVFGQMTKPKIAAPAEGALFAAGTYEAESPGYTGASNPIKVKVTVSDNKIENIEYTIDGETPTVGGMAVPALAEKVLAVQSPNIDIVTNATVSSKGFLTAVSDALRQAGADPDALVPQQVETAAEDVEKTADIVVAGAGGAGMTAAITAAQNGKTVIILEKGMVPGGNSSYATGGMNAAETHYQAEAGIEDSVDLYYSDTMKGGHDINDPELVRTLAENSSAAIDWLDSIDAPLSDVGLAGGASAYRQHRPVDENGDILSVGTFLVEHLAKTCDELGIEIIYGAKVDEILMADGKAEGLHATGTDGSNITVHADSVIIATGGFGSNPDLIVKYRPDLKGYVSTNAPTITGDAIAFLEDVGADFRDFEQIQIHPTVVQTDGSLISESLRGDGAILLNKNGVRFTNENGTRDVVSAAVNEQPESYAWLVTDEKVAAKSNVIKKYVSKGYMIKCDTFADLAKLIGVEEAVIQETLDTWHTACETGEDTEFGRANPDKNKTFVSELPLYAVKISPGIHHCMGGVVINTNAEVLDTEGNVIPGLYAAGEVTGGVHGGNRLGGNAVTDFVVFGRIAGENASANSK